MNLNLARTPGNSIHFLNWNNMGDTCIDPNLLHSLNEAIFKVLCEKKNSLNCVQLFVIPWTIQSLEFSRPEYQSGVAFSFSRGSS